MAIPRYDVLKRDCGGLLWIEAVDDLESARLIIQELSSASHGEYFVAETAMRFHQMLSGVA